MMQDDDNDDIDATSNWWGASTLPANAVNDKVETDPILTQQPTTCGHSGGGTPTATPTPTPTPTLSPQDLADIFPVPLAPDQSVPNPPGPVRLSNRFYPNYLAQRPGVKPLCTRDINPPNPGNYPIISPGIGEVIIVDGVAGGSNSNVGNFVAISLPVATLPDEIKDAISDAYPGIAGLIGSNTGSLFIGFAHLESFAPGVSGFGSNSPEIPLGRGDAIGTSGETESEITNQDNRHLDIRVFYIQSERVPRFGDRENHNTFNVYYLREDLYGSTQLIDPLVLWPIFNTFAKK